MQELILPILTSFIIVLISTPSFIKIAIHKRLFDEPSEDRKIHTRRVPLMGGMMIFGGTLFSFLLWLPVNEMGVIKFLIPSLLIMFFVGMKDDIIGTAPTKKLVAHLVVAFIMVLMADVRLTSLHGLFGVREIPDWAGIMLSIFTYIVVINAFNLIDGVDGLAAGVGLIATVVFGFWFYYAGDWTYSVLSFSLAGALLGFLIYNFNPAKIFMGDTGSLIIGFLIAVMAIELVEYHAQGLPLIINNISKPILSMSILVYPLIDTIRVFTLRAIKGVSPFTADRNHIHHKLIDLGLSQKQTVFIIYFFNLLIIGAAVFSQQFDPSYSFIVIISSVIIIVQIPFLIKKRKIKRENAQ
ncbi:MAG: undecaprenyl/decaprenyl-phosphate alpha-N-acetylglucosaminyl 1-phosphate transferase [Flavobacteriales bacterium CG_4_10_14_0_2_um_filter_32_8]|nr:MAG: undecaprenyl/decaprenyl-phosphate alpha-N-acetylglucosaminyl 1-phosphate transferase [Flavobacteriales bacterium CG_4_10_14_0_2_um_filter_32_8]